MTSLELNPAVFSILSKLIDDKIGLHYGLLDRDILQEKASARAIEAGFNSLIDYYYFLRYDPDGEKELALLVETLVVNETYLFREWSTIKVLVDEIIKPWCAEGRRPRIWSAACATGEEPVSLAMLLNENDLLHKVDIVASDISNNALKKALSGQYSKRSVRAVPDPKLLDRYVTSGVDGHLVTSDLIHSIRWLRVNLMSDSEVEALGKFDIILCRNVLIYFSDETVKHVLARLSKALSHDGALAVGISESLLRYGNTFVGEECCGSFLYRKPVEL